MINEEGVSLDNICEGAAIERFNFAMQAIVENVLDPNTVATAPRELTLKLKIKPDKDRSFANVEMSVTNKLAPIAPVGVIMAINPNSETFHEVKQAKQMELSLGKVTPMAARRQ